MKTQCTGEQLEFHALGGRSVTGRFDDGRISSDAGGVLLREVDKRIGLTTRVSRCFVDHRNPMSVEHSVHDLVAQRIYAIALGYKNLNHHGELRNPLVSPGHGVIDRRGRGLLGAEFGIQVSSAGVSRVGGSASMSPSDWALGSSVNTRRRYA